jgi:hypothetical protein
MEEYCTHLAEYFSRKNGSNAAQSDNFLLLMKLLDNTLHFGVHLHVSPLAEETGTIKSFFFFIRPTLGFTFNLRDSLLVDKIEIIKDFCLHITIHFSVNRSVSP